MQNSQNKIIVIIGTLLIVAGIMILSSNYFNEKLGNAYSQMNSLLLANEEIVEIQEEVDNIDESTSLEENKETKVYVDPYEKYYIGSLEIPKINLKKGFTSMDSPYNSVNKNVEVVKKSSYPDIENGNFILAAHSGNSYLAYFRNLYQLTIGDKAYINYKNKKYTYKIVNIYEQEKTGKIAIYRDLDKNTLTLITCTKNSHTKQTIYILELESVINI